VLRKINRHFAPFTPLSQKSPLRILVIPDELWVTSVHTFIFASKANVKNAFSSVIVAKGLVKM
jgi:hypothetical protein